VPPARCGRPNRHWRHVGIGRSDLPASVATWVSSIDAWWQRRRIGEVPHRSLFRPSSFFLLGNSRYRDGRYIPRQRQEVESLTSLSRQPRLKRMSVAGISRSCQPVLPPPRSPRDSASLVCSTISSTSSSRLIWPTSPLSRPCSASITTPCSEAQNLQRAALAQISDRRRLQRFQQQVEGLHRCTVKLAALRCARHDARGEHQAVDAVAAQAEIQASVPQSATASNASTA